LSNTGTATNIVFNLPVGTNATLGDDGVSNTLSELSGVGIETTDFANPSGTLTIHPGSNASSITVNNLPDFSAGLTLASTATNEAFGNITLAGAIALANNSVSATA